MTGHHRWLLMCTPTQYWCWRPKSCGREDSTLAGQYYLVLVPKNLHPFFFLRSTILGPDDAKSTKQSYFLGIWRLSGLEPTIFVNNIFQINLCILLSSKKYHFIWLIFHVLSFSFVSDSNSSFSIWVRFSYIQVTYWATSVNAAIEVSFSPVVPSLLLTTPRK